MPDTIPASPVGPFETEADVSRTAAVQAVFAAFDADPGVGKMRPMNQRMLDEACTAAGIELGAYDRQILAWLANWEPQVCAVIAGLITRAYQAAPAAALGRYDKDPEALAWARGEVEAVAKRYEAFADRDRAEGKDERAAEWLALADRIRLDLIGTPDGEIASFDERLPALEEHSGAQGTHGGRDA